MLFDNSLRGSKYKSENQNFDYKKILLEQKKIDKNFLNQIKLLTIEEVLYLKLDSITSSLKGKLMGFPIYKLLHEICKEAFVKYALSATKNKRDAANMLGVNMQHLNNKMKKYDIQIKKQSKKTTT
jgi:DNA-binding NtrC family response regulator